MASVNSTSLKVSEVYKNFDRESHAVEVLRGISFEMDKGKSLAITGPSGSGKVKKISI